MMIIDSYRRQSAIKLLWNLFAATGLTLTLLLPMRVGAQVAIEPRDLPMLPQYCKDTQDFRARVPGGGDVAAIARWFTVMGPSFNNMHHYCYALMNVNRALFFGVSREERLHLFSSSITEMNYVIDRAPPNFKMLPEIFTKKGESLIRLGKGQEAMREFLRAIKLKSDYWPPYADISDFYKDAGDVASARKWLNKGLSVLPNAKALMQRLAELDSPKATRKTAPGSTRKPGATLPPE